MDIRNKGLIAAVLILFLCSTIYFTKAAASFAISDMWIDEKELGEMCINNVISAAKIEEDKSMDSEGNGETDTTDDQEGDFEEITGEDKSISKEEKMIASGVPLVIIYHTHSSESYMPYKESNYHREDEEGTVRDVGDVLERELENMGINVIHDKTMHDRPSYNESYDRSLNTIQSLVKKYPTADYVIDLHRDAAAASATEGKYIEIDGKKVAKFSMVVGRKNENYTELYDFAKKVSSRAESMYDGFGGAIIEKDYNYNEFVSDNAILLEIGNNKNTIEEARACGEYFAEVLASLIKEEQ